MAWFQSPQSKRALVRFKSSRRGVVSLWLFLVLFALGLLSPLIANDKPLIVSYNDSLYFPVFKTYPETIFGGVFESETDYHEVFIKDKLNQAGNWAVFPLIEYRFDTIDYISTHPNPAPPSAEHWLGTDDRGRDVLSRLLYGFIVSVLFALALTIIGVVIGIAAGAIQGYFGGRVDLIAQRFIEIWGSMPELYLLIIFASLFNPSIWLLLILLSLFGWMGLSDYVRAEFLKGRNRPYVQAAQAMGLPRRHILWQHLLPNSLTPVITFLPFRISAAVLALTSLDFLGLGVPPSTPSLGELLSQGKENIESWWLSLSTFIVLVVMLTLLIFIGEALREALDSRRGGVAG